MAQNTFDLERSIAKWRQQMIVAGITLHAHLDELESHLRDEVGRQTESGLSDSEAFFAAIQKIGPAATVQAEFKKVEKNRKSALRQLLLTLLAVIGSETLLDTAFRIDFAARVMLGIGLGFMILLTLIKNRVLDHEKLVNLRLYAVVGNFILGVLLVRPEILTQAVAAVVLQSLFESGVWIAGYWERQDRKTQES